MQVIKKQEVVKKAIKDACPTCQGYGCRTCASKIECINAWSVAGIPVAYWDYDINSFPGDEKYKANLEKILNKIQLLYDSGKSIVFHGVHGTGKTFGACEILKTAVVNGYSIKYTTMNEIVDMLLAREVRYDFKQALLTTDIIAIDEFDGRFIPTSDHGKEIFGQNLENIIRTRFQNNLPILFCTNNDDLKKVFSGNGETFQETFNSLFSTNNLIDISVNGVDLR